MKKILMILMCLLCAGWANAAPFLVCDPQTGVDYYEITGDITEANVPAQPNGSIRYDLRNAAAQVHSLEIKACNVWGCSPAASFSFEKKIPIAPSTMQISPN